jgi:hypothetical protein
MSDPSSPNHLVICDTWLWEIESSFLPIFQSCVRLDKRVDGITGRHVGRERLLNFFL